MIINWLDVILLLPLLVGLVRGLMRGLVSEIIAILAVILGVLSARLWAAPFSEWLFWQFKWPVEICSLVAYVLLFLATAVALSIFARLFTKLLRAIHLGWANRLFGGIFGILKYGIIVLVLIFVMDRTNQAFHYLDESPIVKTSIIYPYGVKMVNSIIQETETITTTTTTTTTTTITR